MKLSCVGTGSTALFVYCIHFSREALHDLEVSMLFPFPL